MGLRSSPKYLTFDVFSVLFDWESTLRPLVGEMSKGQSEAIDVSAFLQIWRRKQLEYSYITTMLGKGHVRFETLTRRALEYSLRFFQIRAQQDRVKELVDAWGELEAFPEVNEALFRLKKRYPIAMLSNGDEDVLKKLADRLQIKFDPIISGDMAGAYKPHPGIYLKAVELIGHDAPSIMHVAGSGLDVIGAKAVGLTAAWVNRKKVPMDDWDHAPDLEVKDLQELSSMLLSKLS